MARRRYRKKKTTANLAKQVAKIQKTLVVRQPERKWFEVYSTSETATASGTFSTGGVISLNAGLSQGLGDFGTRTGDTINMTGLRFRMIVNNQGLEFAQVYRIIIFQYLRDPDGATSTASILNLLMHSTHIGTVNAVMTPYDHDNRASFKVHYDKTFTLQAGPYNTAGSDSMGTSHHHKINIKFPPKYAKVQFYNAGSTTTKNELFFTVLTNSGTGIYIPYVANLYYTDV